MENSVCYSESTCTVSVARSFAREHVCTLKVKIPTSGKISQKWGTRSENRKPDAGTYLTN